MNRVTLTLQMLAISLKSPQSGGRDPHSQWAELLAHNLAFLALYIYEYLEGTGDAPVNLTADEGESGAEGSIGPASATEGEEEAVRVQRPHRTVEFGSRF